MRGVTYVQAFQYWVKVFAIALPGDPAADPPRRPARARRAVRQRAPETGPNGLTVELDEPTDADVPGAPARRAPSRRASCELPPDTASRSPTGIDAQTGDEWSRPVERVRPRLAAADLQPAAGDVPRHDGPAAHPRPLLHEPRRLGRAPDDRARARPARRSSTCSPPSTACSAARSRPSSTSPATPTGRAARARRRVARAAGRHARRDRRRRRVRRVHEHRLRAAGLASPARSRTTSARAQRASAAGRGSGSPRRRHGPARAARARHARASTSPCSSAGRSRSPRARSARCCCSASGGRA